MSSKLFLEFVNRKQREARRHLQIIEQVLKNAGLSAKAFLEEDQPYVYLKSTNPKVSFEGVRIYEVGGMIAYRVTKEKDTEPYGRAYQLDLEDMFNDYMSESPKEEEAGKKVMKSVVSELKRFFDMSADAERDLKDRGTGDGGVILKTGGTDYSSLVFNKS